MEDIVKTIFISLLSSSLVFFFSQRALKVKDKEDNKKKLNKLLFHLLLLKKELSLINGINELVVALIDKLKSEFINKLKMPIEELNEVLTPEFVSTMNSNLKQVLLNKDEAKFKKIKLNTEIIINELSETKPLFALDLEHLYNIDEKTSQIEKGINNLEYINDIPDLPKIVMPEVEKRLIKNLDDIIFETALKIDTKTYNDVIKQINFYNNTDVDLGEVNDIFEIVMRPFFQSIIDSNGYEFTNK
ncbi:MAG: hypothetical protein K2P85_02890 [Flavobacteriaceae bacterium]|nr:hypothetical protein [Flavobacteriaceae bacterium]